MVILLYILFILAALILTLIVLIQDDQGEGIGGLFGGGSSTPFGSRSGNVLTRFTGILAAVFLVTCVILGLANRSSELKELASPAAQTIQEQFFEPLPNETVAPEAGAGILEEAAVTPVPETAPAPVSTPSPEQ